MNLTLAADELEASLRHGAKVVDLDGAASGKALLQDVQWDTFFKHVLHVDLLRVRAGEKVKIDVPIELRGEARAPAKAASSSRWSTRSRSKSLST